MAGATGGLTSRVDADGGAPVEGLDHELCFGSGDWCKVSMVWDSQEQVDAFGIRLGPILVELGIDPGEPEIVEVPTIFER